ncbi:MAG TPA: hydrogenase maturation nickel metallochaperone HypA [Candidatus Faecimorpha stercoravium]|nr:hydrogenase maturation nickel metallochaperone HypA [Candidatus Faecimorpha stercoravium]
MHEMSILMSMVEMAEQYAKQQHAERITGISLEIGEMSAVVPEYVEFLFPDVTEGTMLEGAELSIRRQPVCVCCRDCDTVYEWRKEGFRCPACGSEAAQIVSGREFKIQSIEIRKEDENDGSGESH